MQSRKRRQPQPKQYQHVLGTHLRTLVVVSIVCAVAVIVFTVVVNAQAAGASENTRAGNHAVQSQSPSTDDSGLMNVGVRYETATVPPKVTSDQAIATASNWLGIALTSQATQISTQYVLFSDDQYYSTDTQGVKQFKFQRVPAWVVTFTDVPIPSHGPVGQPTQFNHELHVVINAETGEYMESYSYR